MKERLWGGGMLAESVWIVWRPKPWSNCPLQCLFVIIKDYSCNKIFLNMVIIEIDTSIEYKIMWWQYQASNHPCSEKQLIPVFLTDSCIHSSVNIFTEKGTITEFLWSTCHTKTSSGFHVNKVNDTVCEDEHCTGCTDVIIVGQTYLICASCIFSV